MALWLEMLFVVEPQCVLWLGLYFISLCFPSKASNCFLDLNLLSYLCWHIHHPSPLLKLGSWDSCALFVVYWWISSLNWPIFAFLDPLTLWFNPGQLPGLLLGSPDFLFRPTGTSVPFDSVMHIPAYSLSAQSFLFLAIAVLVEHTLWEHLKDSFVNCEHLRLCVFKHHCPFPAGWKVWELVVWFELWRLLCRALCSVPHRMGAGFWPSLWQLWKLLSFSTRKFSVQVPHFWM